MLDLNDARPQPPEGTPPRLQYDLDALSQGLAERAAEIFPPLFPHARLDGDELRMGDISGKPPRKDGSCAVKLKGDEAGCFYDHSTGKGGRPLLTLKEATGLSGRALFDHAAGLIGAMPNKPKSNGHAKSRRTDAEIVRDIAFIRQHCVPATGTLAETYLNSRGLDLPDCPDLLFHPSLTDWEQKIGRPAMVAIVRRPDTVEPTGGIHRTYLADDGTGKADMPKAKLTLGPCGGGVAMLMPMTAGVLGVAEGIETSLAAAKIFGVPTWAALSAGGVRKFTAPPGLKQLTIFADIGDDGERAAWALHEEITAAGIAAFVVLPKSGDDFAKDLTLGHTVMDYRPEPPPQTAVLAAQGLTEQQQGRAIIKVGGGSLPFSIDQAEEILIDSDNKIFQRGDFVVRPSPAIVSIADSRETSALRLVPMRPIAMTERFTRFIDFQRFNAKEKKWVPTDCPPNLAAAYLERTGDWNLPVLSGIANAPTLRPDGSILDQPGYDADTGILYDPRGLTYPSIPKSPTKADALAALALLKSLISEFPFVNDVDEKDAELPGRSSSRSVALSGILTAVIRRSIPHAPLHAFTAPAAGTGKSKLVDLASMIASGHEAPVLAQGKTEEEMEKRLGAALMAGDTLISFDNCEQPLGGELICQALTQATLDIRILGRSVNKRVLSNAAMFATGNNLVVIGDMTRRTLVGALDAKVERPENRTFKDPDPIDVVRHDRAKYVVAALTVLRAYHVAGRPEQCTKPLGSFEVWSRRVRDALIWLGEPDPCATMERARAEDPRLQALNAVLHHWETAIGLLRPLTVQELIETATDYPPPSDGIDLNKRQFLHSEFREVLLVVAGDAGFINSRRLGTWLGRNKGKIAGGLRLVPATMRDGEKRWQVESAPS